MNASLNEKLRAVKWGEFKLGDLFEVVSYKKCFDANKVAIIENRGHPYIVRQSTENGRKGNIDEPIKYLNPGNTISFGQDTATMFYQEKPYFTGDKIKILRPKYAKFGKNNAQFFLSTMRKAFCSFAWGSSRFNVETLKKQMVSLPIKNNGCNGVQREHNKKLNNGLPILHKVPPKRDYGRYFCIMAEKGGTSHGGLTEKLSPFFHAKKQEVNAYGR